MKDGLDVSYIFKFKLWVEATRDHTYISSFGNWGRKVTNPSIVTIFQ